MSENVYCEIELRLMRLWMELDFPCSVNVWWKKGRQKAASQHVRVADSAHYVDFNDSLRITAKCRLRDGHFQPYLTNLQVLLQPTNSQVTKTAGVIEDFDLTQMIDPSNYRAPARREFTIPLKSIQNNTRLQFTLTSTFLKVVIGEESMADMSFQNGTQSAFGRSTDMTFRPNGTEDKQRRTSRNRDMPPIEEKIEKVESRKDYQERSPLQRESIQRDSLPREQPLGFSFGPQVGQAAERERQMLETINQLSRELAERKRGDGAEDKKLHLINELNAAVNQAEQLKRERNELTQQLAKCREEVRELLANSNRIKEENRELRQTAAKAREDAAKARQEVRNLREQSSQMGLKLEGRRKEAEELRMRMEKLQRDNEEMRNQIFKKQNELITNEKYVEEVRNQFASKSIPVMEELKRCNQDLGRQRAELERTLTDKQTQLAKELQLRESAERRLQQVQEELEREKTANKTKTAAFEARQRQKELNLAEIEEEIAHLMTQQREKDTLIAELTTRRQDQDRRRSEQDQRRQQLLSRQAQANQIQISQQRVRIKNLEEICVNLQKDVGERERELHAKCEFIEKAREYITVKQEELRGLQETNSQLNQYIERAKQYITNKEREFQEQMNRLKAIPVQKDTQQRTKLQVERHVLEIERLKLELDRTKTEAERFKIEAIRCREEADRLKQELDKTRIQNDRSRGEVVRMRDQLQTARSQRMGNSSLFSQLEEKDEYIMRLMEDGALKQGQIEELQDKLAEWEEYLRKQHERLEMMQEEIEEFSRKDRSQKETLEDLVKKNLELEMQLNMRNFQLQTLKGRR